MKTIAYFVVALLTLTTGCSMCCGLFDYDYPTFGGRHMRADRSHGRVGSILSDPATTLNGPSADSNLVAHPEPGGINPEDDTIDLESAPEDDFEDDADSSLEDLDKELEGIEPLRDVKKKPSKAPSDDSTASTRWRPRPLR